MSCFWTNKINASEDCDDAQGAVLVAGYGEGAYASYMLYSASGQLVRVMDTGSYAPETTIDTVTNEIVSLESAPIVVRSVLGALITNTTVPAGVAEIHPTIDGALYLRNYSGPEIKRVSTTLTTLWETSDGATKTFHCGSADGGVFFSAYDGISGYIMTRLDSAGGVVASGISLTDTAFGVAAELASGGVVSCSSFGATAGNCDVFSAACARVAVGTHSIDSLAGVLPLPDGGFIVYGSASTRLGSPAAQRFSVAGVLDAGWSITSTGSWGIQAMVLLPGDVLVYIDGTDWDTSPNQRVVWANATTGVEIASVEYDYNTSIAETLAVMLEP